MFVHKLVQSIAPWTDHSLHTWRDSLNNSGLVVSCLLWGIPYELFDFLKDIFSHLARSSLVLLSGLLISLQVAWFLVRFPTFDVFLNDPWHQSVEAVSGLLRKFFKGSLVSYFGCCFRGSRTVSTIIAPRTAFRQVRRTLVHHHVICFAGHGSSHPNK